MAIEDRSAGPERPRLVAAQLICADPAEEIALGEWQGEVRVDLVERSRIVACAIVGPSMP